MKNIFLYSLLLLSFSQPACKKEGQKAVDCFGESLLVSVKGTADADNPKKIIFEATYSGSYTVNTVKWSFGDASPVVSTGLTTEHTYSAAGNYTVKASITIQHNSGNCTVEPVKTITVN